MAHATPIKNLSSQDFLLYDPQTKQTFSPEEVILIPMPPEEVLEDPAELDEWAKTHEYQLTAPVRPLR